MTDGIIMLPTMVATVGAISIYAWIETIICVMILAYAFAKCGIMGPLSRPRSKILRVAVSRIILSSEASKVKLVGNLVA